MAQVKLTRIVAASNNLPTAAPARRLIAEASRSTGTRAAVANHFSANSKFSTIDFSAAPTMAPLGPCVDVFGDGAFWAISVPGHTDDDIAYLINSASPVLLTGDASHFAWAFKTGVAPRGWNSAGTTRGYVSLERLRAFASAYPSVKLIYGHEAERL